ncbi:MAG: hypothetical protein P8Z50_07085 [candidate division WOR-3 bacterium]
MEKKIIIRKFSKKDIEDVRRIACETAFGGSSRYDFFEDDEILADLLTRYYTDYRPFIVLLVFLKANFLLLIFLWSIRPLCI